MNLVPVLLAWHSTLYNLLPSHDIQNTSKLYLERAYQGSGLQIRHMLQLPVKMILSVTLVTLATLVTLLPVLPFCTEAIGITVRN
jgi:hypothetical protein